MIRVSLRDMFVLVAVVAVAIVSLLFASPVWQAIIGVAVTLSAIVAVIVSLVDRGPRRAFAIGFAVAMFGYLLVVHNAKNFNVERFPLGSSAPNPELSVYNGRLPTSVTLQYLYAGISRTTNFDANTGERIPESESGNLHVIGEGFGGMGGGAFGLGPNPAPPGLRAAYVEIYPPRENFMVQGHFWWALLFGYIGGHFARYVYLRRDREAPNNAAS